MSSNKSLSVEHFNDANKLYKGKLYTEALTEYQKAVEIDTTFYDAHFCVAKTLMRLSKIDEGLAHFNKYSNLIPEDKKGNYLFALSKILVEQHAPEKALKLVTDSAIPLNENQNAEYINILFANGKIKDGLHGLLNFNKDRVASVYSTILENEALPEYVRTNLKEDNIVPLFFNAVKKINTLKTANILHKDYKNQIEDIQQQLTKVKTDKDIYHLKEIDDIYLKITESQVLLEEQTETLLKVKNTSKAKQIISVLKQTKYDEKSTKKLEDKLQKLEKDKQKKVLKSSAIIVCALLILGIGGFFGLRAYEKSSAREYALRNGTVNAYTNYLNKYGKDSEIDKLREEKLYKTAIETNDANDFAQLSRTYPLSKHLKTIEVEFGGENNISRRSYGLGNIYKNTDVTGGKTLKFKAPIGAKVGYTISASNMIPIDRVFTVSDNLEINERLVPAKELVFNESFNSNKNKWNTFDSPKTSYGRTQNKGVRVSDGELQLYNEQSDNQFTYSSIYTSKTSSKGDFEIEASITRNDKDRGTYLMFGMANRAFNYIGISGGSIQFGYNNWNNSSDKWVNLSNGWKRNNAIKTGKYDTNIVKVVKSGDTFTFYVNNSYVGSMPKKRWYGNRIGFGVNERTSAKINSISISKTKTRTNTNFKKGSVYFCWVDELNVRSNGTKKGEILTTIKLAEPVRFTGNIGDKKLNATFKGVFSPDYYYEVELLDGTKGWVHGGALKDIPSKKQIDFKSFKSESFPKTITNVTSTDISEFYMISVYAEKTENSVKNRVTELKNNGFNANYLWIPDYKSLSGAQMYAAYIGPFANKEACKTALSRAKKKYPKAYGLMASKNTTQRIVVN